MPLTQRAIAFDILLNRMPGDRESRTPASNHQLNRLLAAQRPINLVSANSSANSMPESPSRARRIFGKCLI